MEYEFEARWGYTGYIKVHDIETCHVCKARNVKGVEIDSSEGEYGSGRICLDCIDACKAVKNSTWRTFFYSCISFLTPLKEATDAAQ